MDKITYLGEHLAIGNIGHLAVVLAFCGSLLAAIAYLIYQKNQDKSYLKTARIAFWVHVAGVLGIVITLFTIIFNHYYEYQYAWKHSSNELPLKYMISCFWEGQEGSFLLWMFWNCVLGAGLLFSARKWEAPVVAIVCLAQVGIGSMLLGVEFGSLKIGNSPFELFRHAQANIPILSRPDYISYIKDGNGLNPLLQNYWMVIHPPTLFLGFAACIVPFAFAIAGMTNNSLREWIRPALPWTLGAVMVLGAGIVMGGFWAYESLTFGGYWAWDPVENASLMPWLLMVVLLHLMLINRATGRHSLLSIVLACFAYLLVLYASFLTRSGILGDSSVHSFTGEGTMGQLLIFMVFFFGLTILAGFESFKTRILLLTGLIALTALNLYNHNLAVRVIDSIALAGLSVYFILNLRNRLQDKTEDEKTDSREFWMFVGSMTIFLSLFQIIFQTSNPVWNQMFNLSLAVKNANHFNSIQLWFGMAVAILMGAGQFFRYKKTEIKGLTKSLSMTFAISSLTSVLLWLLFDIKEFKYILFLFFATFAVVSNLYFMAREMKGGFRFSGASISHAGFGIMLIGILVSSVNKHIISADPNMGNVFSKAEDNVIARNEFIMLDKNNGRQMGEYMVTYKGTKDAKPNRFYQIEYQKKDAKGNVSEAFTLEPYSQDNPKMGFISNPDTRHYLTRDVFTYVSYEEKPGDEEWNNFKTDSVSIGQLFMPTEANRKLTLNKVTPFKSEKEEDIRVVADITVDVLGETFTASPEFILRDGKLETPLFEIPEAGFAVAFVNLLPNKLNPENTKYVFTTALKPPQKGFIVMKAIVFPYINLLWSGTIIMLFGISVSIFRRWKESRIAL